MRSFLFGLLIIAAMVVTLLAVRPGGLRRQLKFAARRLRIVLALGGVFVFGSLVIRIFFPTGPLEDYGPPVLAIALGATFMFVGRDPVAPDGESAARPGRR